MTLRIAVYAIAKDESAFVERFCASARDADVIVIADTGSSDDTISVARRCGAVVHSIGIAPWRFDKARDAALSLVPMDIDVCVSVDLDEVLVPGWREEIERHWTPGVTRLRYGFDWGNGLTFQDEKIHARVGYSWQYPCHEYLKCDVRQVEVMASTSAVIKRHLPDHTKSRGSYIDLLEMAVLDNPQCARSAFYYARELGFLRRWQEAVDAWHHWLSMPGSDWPVERCYAARVLAVAYEQTGRLDEARHWYDEAIRISPDEREPWYALSCFLYRQQEWYGLAIASERALSCNTRSLWFTDEPEAWGAHPHDLAALAAYHIKDIDRAVAFGNTALALDPQNARLAENLTAYQQAAHSTLIHSPSSL